MAKKIVVYIFAFVLLISIALGCVAVFKIGKGISDSFDTLFVTDTQTDSGVNNDTGTNSDTGASTESETVPDAITPHTIKLGDSGLQVCATNNNTTALLGLRTYDLKPNTKYRVTWNINPDIVADMENELPISFIFNTVFVVFYSSDFASVSYDGADLNSFVFSSTDELCANSGGCEFTSGDLGDEFALYFFTMPFESTEATIAAKSYVTQYVTDFTITEVLE